MTVIPLDSTLKKKSGCSNCGKPVDTSYKPFCSKRCADVDLNRWFGENYKMPTEEIGIANDPYGDDENY